MLFQNRRMATVFCFGARILSRRNNGFFIIPLGDIYPKRFVLYQIVPIILLIFSRIVDIPYNSDRDHGLGKSEYVDYFDPFYKSHSEF